MIKKLIERQNRWLNTPAKRPMTNKEGYLLTNLLVGYGMYLGYMIAKEKWEEEKTLVEWEDLYDAPDGNVIGEKKVYKVTEVYLNKSVTVFGHEFKYRKKIRII